MNPLIFGNGFIGARLRKAYNCALSTIRLSSLNEAIAEIEKYKPDVVINCIGFTGGANVDGCEKEKQKTMDLNVFIPIILSEACFRTGVKFVHISSGCIYHFQKGSLPIDETVEPDFFDLFYSRSKIYAERALNENDLIIRIRIPLDYYPHPHNILTKLLTFDRILNSANSITYLPDLIKAVEYLIEIRASGIYNVVNEGPLYYIDLLSLYNLHSQSPHKYIGISYEELGLVRTNIILSVKKLLLSGFYIRSISEAIRDCVTKYVDAEPV